MKKRILLMITILITMIIFIHSSIPAVESTVESEAAYGILDSVTEFIHLPNLFTAVTIRKLAHFCEFAVFGFFLSGTVKAYCTSLKNEVFKILFFLLCVPVIDETIQYFPLGRSAQVSDVLLDFSGGMFGFLCMVILAAAAAFLHKRKSSRHR